MTRAQEIVKKEVDNVIATGEMLKTQTEPKKAQLERYITEAWKTFQDVRNAGLKLDEETRKKLNAVTSWANGIA